MLAVRVCVSVYMVLFSSWMLWDDVWQMTEGI